MERRAERGVLARRRPEIRIEPNRLEEAARGEGLRHAGLGGARTMQRRERRADAARELGIDATGEKLRLPDRVRIGRQPLHREGAGVRIVPQQPRHGPGRPGSGPRQPGGLEGVALDGDGPVLLDLEPRQGAIHAEDAIPHLDAQDVRRDAAGDRRDPRDLARRQQPHRPECGDQRRIRRAGVAVISLARGMVHRTEEAMPEGPASRRPGAREAKGAFAERSPPDRRTAVPCRSGGAGGRNNET